MTSAKSERQLRPPFEASAAALANPAEAWFLQRQWLPFDFQRQVWAAMLQGRSGLLHATTGSGKTYAVWLGALLRAAGLAALHNQTSGRAASAAAGSAAIPAASLQVLWLTPMRALASDTTRALQQPLAALAPGWTLGQRTGDTPASERARQDRRLPQALVTTPESLSLLLARDHAPRELAAVHTVLVDEWHELIGNKRGVQVQLALARLRHFNPGLVVWGLSATLGNVQEAMATLLPAVPAVPDLPGGRLGTPTSLSPLLSSSPVITTATPAPCLVQGQTPKTLQIDTLLPPLPGRFSWAGHLGAQMCAPVVAEIEKSGTSLVFTNTRSQAEIWYQLLLQAKPEWAG